MCRVVWCIFFSTFTHISTHTITKSRYHFLRNRVHFLFTLTKYQNHPHHNSTHKLSQKQLSPWLIPKIDYWLNWPCLTTCRWRRRRRRRRCFSNFIQTKLQRLFHFFFLSLLQVDGIRTTTVAVAAVIRAVAAVIGAVMAAAAAAIPVQALAVIIIFIISSNGVVLMRAISMGIRGAIGRKGGGLRGIIGRRGRMRMVMYLARIGIVPEGKVMLLFCFF